MYRRRFHILSGSFFLHCVYQIVFPKLVWQGRTMWWRCRFITQYCISGCSRISHMHSWPQWGKETILKKRQCVHCWDSRADSRFEHSIVLLRLFVWFQSQGTLSEQMILLFVVSRTQLHSAARIRTALREKLKQWDCIKQKAFSSLQAFAISYTWCYPIYIYRSQDFKLQNIMVIRIMGCGRFLLLSLKPGLLIISWNKFSHEGLGGLIKCSHKSRAHGSISVLSPAGVVTHGSSQGPGKVKLS